MAVYFKRATRHPSTHIPMTEAMEFIVMQSLAVL